MAYSYLNLGIYFFNVACILENFRTSMLMLGQNRKSTNVLDSNSLMYNQSELVYEYYRWN